MKSFYQDYDAVTSADSDQFSRAIELWRILHMQNF